MTDLNDHLFAQLERLSDEDLLGDKLAEEIGRAKAVAGIASQIIGNAQLVLDAEIAVNDRFIKKVPKMLGVESYEEKGVKGKI